MGKEFVIKTAEDFYAYCNEKLGLDGTEHNKAMTISDLITISKINVPKKVVDELTKQLSGVDQNLFAILLELVFNTGVRKGEGML